MTASYAGLKQEYITSSEQIFSGKKWLWTADTVALHKYVRRRGKGRVLFRIYPFKPYGVSTKVPLKEEITSNFAPAQVRELTIKNVRPAMSQPCRPVKRSRWITALLRQRILCSLPPPAGA